MQSYLTVSNDGMPFRVDISDDVVEVFYQCTRCSTYKPVKVFIGKSPLTVMTRASGAHGPEYDGNTILLYMGDLTYIYIGDRIQSFKAKSEIVSYLSEVGNNDMAYPYAVDDKENVYLIIEKVIVPLLSSDPYAWYYKMSEMTPHEPLTETEIRKWKKTNILKFYVGIRQLNLRCGKEYEDGSKNPRFYIVTKESYPNKIRLSKEDFARLMDAHRKSIGVEHLELTTIIENFCDGQIMI